MSEEKYPSEYIKREDVQDIIDRELSNQLTNYERIMIEYVIDTRLGKISSTNVVEVVRCKDCKKRNTRTCMMNNNVGMNKDLFDDDYCSYGERKEQDYE